MKLRCRSAIAGAVTLLVVLGTAGASFAAVPPYEPDQGANGTVTLYDANGNQVTSGLISDTTSPAYALGSAPGRAGSGGTDNRATLFGYSPVNGQPPGAWSGEQLSLTTIYIPTASATPANLRTGLPLAGGPNVAGGTPQGLFGQETNGFAGLAATFPNTAPSTSPYFGLYQLRLKTSGPHIGTNPVYQTADIKITGNTWTQVYPVPAATSPPAFTADTPPVTGMVGVTYTYTFTASGTPNPTFSVVSGSLPAGLTLDPTSGVLAGRPTSAGPSTFQVRATNSLGSATTANITITISVPPPAFTADTPPVTGTVGVAYSYTFAASGSPAPSFHVASGTLPPGLALNSVTGKLSGTPTAAGTSTFTVQASNTGGAVTSPSITITVTPVASPPVFTADTPPVTATVGVTYTYTFVATGSPSPTYTIKTGQLPPGITLNASTGALAGTPSATGTVTFTVQAANVAGAVTSPSLTITVLAASTTSTALAFTADSPPAATKGTAYSYTFVATGTAVPAGATGTAIPTYTVSSGTLPTGLTLTAGTGVLAGTPSVTGTYSFVVQASNATATALTPTLTVVVSAAGSTTTTPTSTTTPATTVAATTAAKLPMTGYNIIPDLVLAALCYFAGAALLMSRRRPAGEWSQPGGGLRAGRHSQSRRAPVSKPDENESD